MSLKSFFCGSKINAPEEVEEELIPGEKILHAVRQARIEQLVAPDMIFVTTERVMLRKPDWTLVRGVNKDYRYEDMGNVVVKRGFFNSCIHVRMKFLSYDFVLKAIPHDEARAISSTIQKGIDGRFQGMDGKETRKYRTQRTDASEDLLKILKYRYVKGEITHEEYEQMKNDIRN